MELEMILAIILPGNIIPGGIGWELGREVEAAPEHPNPTKNISDQCRFGFNWILNPFQPTFFYYLRFYGIAQPGQMRNLLWDAELKEENGAFLQDIGIFQAKGRSSCKENLSWFSKDLSFPGFLSPLFF